MHVSEGEQYRRGLSKAAVELHLPVYRMGAERLGPDIAGLVGWSSARLADEHAEVRAAIGPPWQKDHKDASAAALIALRSAA